MLSRSSAVGKKLYVGNLTYNVNESDLEALFAPFGTVQSAQVIVDRDTNRSKGFGFVEMNSDAEALAAIDGLNEREHDGRRLTVNEAKPREARSVAPAAAAATAAVVAAVIDRSTGPIPMSTKGTACRSPHLFEPIARDRATDRPTGRCRGRIDRLG
jgi:cold-inducible RNA-binding protein